MSFIIQCIMIAIMGYIGMMILPFILPIIFFILGAGIVVGFICWIASLFKR